MHYDHACIGYIVFDRGRDFVRILAAGAEGKGDWRRVTGCNARGRLRESVCYFLEICRSRRRRFSPFPYV